MNSTEVHTDRSPTSVAEAPALGDRVRQLRVSSGLTQSLLAGDRFSKEYISQIERGKTRPTAETLTWLASRLGVDRAFLEHGVSQDERARVEAALANAGALIETHSYAAALELLSSVEAAIASTGAADLEVRALSAAARAQVYLGDVHGAIIRLQRAQGLVEDSSFSDIDRGEVAFQLAVCRLKLGSLSTGTLLLTEALRLVESSEIPSDRLRAQILSWRARAYRQQRDYVAAHDDAERALELAEAASDAKAVANSYFQASLIAERQGHYARARRYGERALAAFEAISDRESFGRMLNNIGGLSFLLDRPAEAVKYFKESFRVAVELGNRADAGQALASLAQVHLRAEEFTTAETEARKAIGLLGSREDTTQTVGSAHLTLGRALAEQERFEEADASLRVAEDAFARTEALSQRAETWVAQGDLVSMRGDIASAARLYRRAADALQDVRW